MSEKQVLKQLVKQYGNACVTVLKENWHTAEGSFNEGQQALYRGYVSDAIQEWVDECKEYWPWVDAEHYAMNCYVSYDSEVIDACFSQTINSPIPEMQELIYEAQMLVAILEAIGLGV